MGLQFGENVYISEVNGARKVKSNAQVEKEIDKKSYPMQKFFLSVAEEDHAPGSNFSKLVELSETS